MAEPSRSNETKETLPTIVDVDALRETTTQYISLGEEYDWMVLVFVILFTTAFLSFTSNVLLRALERRLRRTQNGWDDLLVGSLRKPLKLLIWVFGVSVAADLVVDQKTADISEYITPMRELSVVVTIAWTMLRFIRRGQEQYIRLRQKKHRSVDLTTVHAVSKLLNISVIISTSLIVLQTLGISVSGVLAFGGIGGLAVGFAAKDMLANFFGALIIYFDKPFKVGDWIRSPDKEIEGNVEEIGWRMTTIRTLDKRPLYVPNAVFTTISVENPSRMHNRRIHETIGIRYEDLPVMRAIVDDVREMLRAHEEIDTKQTLIVNFTSYNASSCDFFIYAFTKTIDWTTFHAVKQDVLLKISEIIAKHGAQIAFPTQTVYMTPMPEPV